MSPIAGSLPKVQVAIDRGIDGQFRSERQVCDRPNAAKLRSPRSSISLLAE